MNDIHLDSTELNLIVARCRLKAEGCQWAAERSRLRDEGADYQVEIAPFDRQIIGRAQKITDCFLWMNNAKTLTVGDPSLLELLSDCFECLADALGLAQVVQVDLDGNHILLTEVLHLCAEAQSALRVAICRRR